MSDHDNRDDFHEIWWIFSPSTEEWGGLRIAHFRQCPPDNALIVIIEGEMDKRRVGIRIWDDIKDREQWIKVVQIIVPTAEQIKAAMQ